MTRGHKDDRLCLKKTLFLQSLYVGMIGSKKNCLLYTSEILCNLCFNDYMEKSGISEGKIELTSTMDGLFKVNREELFKVNSFGKMMIATRQGNVPVKKGDKLAGMRIIPLVIEKEKMQQIQEKIQKPILKIMPYQIKTAGIITTGSEVYKGRIKDTFTPVIVEKLKEYGVEVTYHSLSLRCV